MSYVSGPWGILWFVVIVIVLIALLKFVFNIFMAAPLVGFDDSTTITTATILDPGSS